MAEVDHKIPIRIDPSLRLAWSNLCSLCKSCHQRKTRNDMNRWPELRVPSGLSEFPDDNPLAGVGGS